MSDLSKVWLSYRPKDRAYKGIIWKRGSFFDLKETWSNITLSFIHNSVPDILYSETEHFQNLAEAQSDLLNKARSSDLIAYGVYSE